MKKILLIALVAIVGISSCTKEAKPPGLTLTDPLLVEDTTYTAPLETPQQKQVLVEEVTGVGCHNCPEAATLLKTIREENDDKVVISAIYGNIFNDPHSQSKYDFRTQVAMDILNTMGQAPLPSAVIDRIPDAQNQFFIGRSEWSTLISNRVSKVSTPINLHLESIYNDETNKLEFTVKTVFTQDYNNDLNLTAYVIENGIVDYQLVGQDYVPDYEHNHVFRDAITSVVGAPLNFGEKKAGNVLQKKFNAYEPKITGVNAWNLDNCYIVAYVSDAKTKEVLHVEEIKLKQ